jgi:putative CocE/NonD family hydrolase
MSVRRSTLKVVLIAGAFLVMAAGAVVVVPSWRKALLEFLPPRWAITAQAMKAGVTVDHSIAIKMADGTVIAGSLYRPRGNDARLPTILVQIPYGRLGYAEGPYNAIYFAKRGYSALVVDLRGTGDSGGELLPWRNAANDGVQVLDWIARQPWSTGKVGTFGCSALGETQMVLGARNHPGHRAIIASGAGGAVGSAAGRYSYFGMFEGGVFQLAGGFGWFVQNGSVRPDAPAAQPFEHASLLRQWPVDSLVSSVRPRPTDTTSSCACHSPTRAGASSDT